LYWIETGHQHAVGVVKVVATEISRPVSPTNSDYVVYIRSIKLYHLYHRRRYATVTVPSMIPALKATKPR